MNQAHRWLCNSNCLRTVIEKSLLPWALEGLDLGTQVLEIGPEPGLTTACLCTFVPNVTCLEVDRAYASSLSQRLAGERVRVLCGDGTAMPLPDSAFDAVVCFTMLHHIRSVALQNRLLTEAWRKGKAFMGIRHQWPFALCHTIRLSAARL